MLGVSLRTQLQSIIAKILNLPMENIVVLGISKRRILSATRLRGLGLSAESVKVDLRYVVRLSAAGATAATARRNVEKAMSQQTTALTAAVIPKIDKALREA